MSYTSGLNSELSDLIHLDDVEAAILFRIDGNVINSAFKEEHSNDVLRTIQWCKSNVEKVSLEMKTNNLAKVTYELNNFNVIFSVVDNVTILTTLAIRTANMSLLAIETKRKAMLISANL
jgi:predicted regulator of Ras-like GTPase activity (Roadblock/LC7/MglB family)